MDYDKEFHQLLESKIFNSSNTRKRKAEEDNEVSNLKTIDQAISLQASLLEKANEKNDLPNYLRWTVILYANLVHDFGFDLVHEVVIGKRERMMGNAHHNNYRPETIPTTFYVLLLIGIVLFFQDTDSVERNQKMIPILQQFLFNGLEENAITAIIYLISDRDFENLQKAGAKYVIYKSSGFNEENLVNSVLIYDTKTNKKYQTAIMPFRMLGELKGLLVPTLPPSDIVKDFVLRQEIYSISNTGVLTYLEQRLKKHQLLENESMANELSRPVKRTRWNRGGKPKTRKSKKTRTKKMRTKKMRTKKMRTKKMRTKKMRTRKMRTRKTSTKRAKTKKA